MRALVLSGGGSAGAWQVGVLKHLLNDLETKYDIVCGVSVGAINGAAIAQFKHGQEKEAYQLLEKLWPTIKNKHIKKHRCPPYIAALWKSSVYKTHPLRKLISTHLDVKQIKESGKILRIGAASLTTGGYKVWNEKSDYLVDAIMASSAFPGLFEPVKFAGEVFVDGGVRNVSPISDAIKAGATQIDVVLTVKGGMKVEQKDWKFKDVLSRSFDIMFDEVVETDLKLCAARNLLSGYKIINTRIIRPSVALTGDLNFNPEESKKQLELGYKDVLNCLQT
jgi:NTE family protein